MNSRLAARQRPGSLLATIPSGKYQLVPVAWIDSEDLRFLAGRCFSRDYELRRAIFSEIESRRPRLLASQRAHVRKRCP